MTRRINTDVLKRMQQLDFAIWETSLYLDGHPENTQALNYYKKLIAMRDGAKKDYEANVGPATHRDVKGDRWTWVDEPWPWQNEV